MLAEMTAHDLQEWQAYLRAEPLSADRTEVMLAQLAALTANINRDSKKKPDPYTVREFMIDTRTEAERAAEAVRHAQAAAWFQQQAAAAQARRALRGQR